MFNNGNWGFPLTLTLILGGLSVWLGSISEINIDTAPINPKQTQYLMQGIKGQYFDEQGKLLTQISAQRAWVLPKDKWLHIQAPFFEQHARTPYRIKSDTARYHLDDKKIEFEQNVVLNIPQTATQADGEIIAQQLSVDTVAQTAHSHQPVRYRYGKSHGTANSIQYDNRTQIFTLTGIKAQIYE